MEMPPNVADEAAYISENFGIPFTAALEITQEQAKKRARKAKRR